MLEMPIGKIGKQPREAMRSHPEEPGSGQMSGGLSRFDLGQLQINQAVLLMWPDHCSWLLENDGVFN